MYAGIAISDKNPDLIIGLEKQYNKADYLICLWDENVFKGAGTHAEVTISYDLKKPVYLINKIPALELSGWIMACSTKIFESFDSLKLFLLDRYNQND